MGSTLLAESRGIVCPGHGRSPLTLVIAFLLWIPAIGFGILTLLNYANTPGRLASPPQGWPAASSISRDPAGPTLLVFAHPQCPCSRATIGELAVIMAQSHRPLRAYVLFYAPRSEETSWVKGSLWNAAAAIPGVRAVEDQDGREVRRFGASISGQTLLYGSNGKLIFNGGITAARGHFGANDGV